jgi:hypothetical protein
MSLKEDVGVGTEPGSFLGVGREKKEQESARWENAAAFFKGGGKPARSAHRASDGGFPTAVHGAAFPRRSGVARRITLQAHLV